MDIIDNISSEIDSVLKPVFNDKVYGSIISLILVLYAGLAAPKLPKTISKLFKSKIFKLIVLIVIAYTASKDASIAIITAVALVVSMQTLSKHEQTDKVVKEIADAHEEEIIDEHEHEIKDAHEHEIEAETPIEPDSEEPHALDLPESHDTQVHHQELEPEHDHEETKDPYDYHDEDHSHEDHDLGAIEPSVAEHHEYNVMPVLQSNTDYQTVERFTAEQIEAETPIIPISDPCQTTPPPKYCKKKVDELATQASKLNATTIGEISGVVTNELLANLDSDSIGHTYIHFEI
jgi:Ca2+/Na+ antiporter